MFNSLQLIDEVLDGKYRIDKQLGQGGMGAVYLATHLGTKRLVALKVITPQFMSNTSFVERFKREAEAMGLLRHPNVVNISDFGFTTFRDDTLAYMVMEYLNGSNLGNLIKQKGKLPLELITDIVEQICLAIHTAHLQGIIHRDLKPDNIWLEPNGRGGYNVKILDFGLAKLRPNIPAGIINKPREKNPIKISLKTSSKTLVNTSLTESVTLANEITLQPQKNEKEDSHESETKIIQPRLTASNDSNSTNADNSLTQVGDVLGTPLYMSPEQCSGEQNLDGRSDIYSLGVIIYQMLAGETPFQGNIYTLVVHHTTTPPPPLQQKNILISEPIANLVMSALAKDPKDRPPDAMAFAAAFRANASGESAFLRQAISLYSEHFFPFVRVAFLGYSPMIFGIVAFFMGMLIPAFHRLEIILAIIIFFYLAQIINNAVTGSLIVRMVAHFIEYPAIAFDEKVVYQAFRQRFKAFVISSLVAHRAFFLYVAIPIIVNSSLPINPNTWAYWVITLILITITGLTLRKDFLAGKWLYSPVTLWENLEGQAALDRSKALVEKLEGSIGKIFPLFVFVMINVSILAIMLGWSFINHISYSRTSSDIAIEITTVSLGIILSIVICTLLCPIIGIGYALFYLKARQAGGEKTFSPNDIMI
ncbi:MAG: serine/threonine protein kinase [Blastocatellia bacterium]|nr:serine/threonine protein kinase [Blastocatellia bacterium]